MSQLFYSAFGIGLGFGAAFVITYMAFACVRAFLGES